MNTEKQRIAIAEACGWTGVASTTSPHIIWGTPPYMSGERMVPAYTVDLNAMHEAEKVLTSERQPSKGESQWSDYLGWLGFCGENKTREVYECVTASAAQRAEAFLRVLGKWQD